MIGFRQSRFCRGRISLVDLYALHGGEKPNTLPLNWEWQPGLLRFDELDDVVDSPKERSYHPTSGYSAG